MRVHNSRFHVEVVFVRSEPLNLFEMIKTVPSGNPRIETIESTKHREIKVKVSNQFR